MAIWRKPLQFINVMLANRSPMSVAERGPGRMTYAKKKIKPFAEHDLRVTLEMVRVKLPEAGWRGTGGSGIKWAKSRRRSAWSADGAACLFPSFLLLSGRQQQPTQNTIKTQMT